MNWRLVATLGVGVTAFLAVSTTLTALLEPTVEFSALVGLPAGLLAGAAAAVATRVRLWNSSTARPALIGVAAVGYALCVVAAASYAVSSVRGSVTVERALVAALLAGAVVFAFARLRPDRLD